MKNGMDCVLVIDVYQEWCGPCKAMVSNFKRFKNEIGDELLRFAVVCMFIVNLNISIKAICLSAMVYEYGWPVLSLAVSPSH